jgi:hypothetical protein
MGTVEQFPKAKRKRKPKRKPEPSEQQTAKVFNSLSALKELNGPAAQAVLLGQSRKTFLHCAGRCYDWWASLKDDDQAR